MDDDQKLKIIFYLMIVLFAVAVIGAWESFVKPTVLFATEVVGY